MPRRRLINTESIERAATEGSLAQHLAARRGYNDAVAGLGWSEWYDRASKNEQLAYEIGRQWVTNLRAAKIPPPEWRKTFPPPQSVQRANTLAAERGEAYATPWGVMPDTKDRVLLEPLGVRIKGGRKRRRRG
jgi:hypothetical protein